MTSQPPASPESAPLPPRHRPALDGLMQETTERDLWDFDEEPYPPEDAWVELPPTRPYGKDIPMPRERPPGKTLETTDTQASGQPAAETQVHINVNKPQFKIHPPRSQARPTPLESTFDDLESWIPEPGNPDIAKPPADEPSAPAPPVKPLAPAVGMETPAESPPDNQPAADAKDMPAPVARDLATPLSLRPNMRLSMIEKAGLAGLLALLLVGGAAILRFSLRQLPTETRRVQTNDFPIKGRHVTIDTATSYWRAPVKDGPSPDTFRHGTQLLPVLELTLNGGPAAIRVLFRNEDHAMIGDVVTRTINGKGTWIIPATAGFNDPGMHAAYRTGEGKRWTIEVLEAPAHGVEGKEFQSLFEMNISTDLR